MQNSQRVLLLGALYGGEDNVRQNKVYVFSEQVIFWENYDWGYDSFARNRGVRFVFFFVERIRRYVARTSSLD